MLKKNEQELKSTKPAIKRTRRKPTPTASVKPTDATVQVKAFAFKGNVLLSSEALQTALASFTNRALTLEQLKEAADAITNTYREAGWTVRAFVPKQEVSNGTVTLQIVEAVFGGASVQSTPFERIEASRLISMAEAMLTKGQPIHASDIDRALLLLDDLPGIQVTGNLVEGQRDGETNLALSVTDEALVTGNASVDNQGSRATGAERLSVNLNINGPARLGDALAIQALVTQGSEYSRLGYTVPVGNQGWRAGLNASHLQYHILEHYQANSGTHGKADTTGAEASYPLVRSQLFNLNTSLGYTHKRFENYKAELLDSNYHLRASNASLSAQQLDNWGGGGMTAASMQLTAGNVDRVRSVDYGRDQAADGQRTAGAFTKFNLSLNRLQTITPDLSLYAAANHQRASKNLDTSEKLYISGATGVRAYPSSEPGGSEGNTVTLELRERVNSEWLVTGFYDHAWLRANTYNNNAETPNTYHLQGYGLSAAWQAGTGIELKATAAQRVGSNPKAKTDGNDGDGTKKVTRYWLSAGIAF